MKEYFYTLFGVRNETYPFDDYGYEAARSPRELVEYLLSKDFFKSYRTIKVYESAEAYGRKLQPLHTWYK